MLDWVDGRPAAELSVRDRGLAYGDGLLETLAVRAGTPRLLERHLARLEEGCRRPGRLSSTPRSVAPGVAGVLRGALGDGVAKLIVTCGEGSVRLRAACRGLAAANPLRIAASGLSRAPLAKARLFACRTRLAEQPLLAGLKHLNRLEQVLARAEWSDAGHAEGLMLDVHERWWRGCSATCCWFSTAPSWRPICGAAASRE